MISPLPNLIQQQNSPADFSISTTFDYTLLDSLPTVYTEKYTVVLSKLNVRYFVLTCTSLLGLIAADGFQGEC